MMGIKIIKPSVVGLVEMELQLANNNFPPFNSPHEGYAVLLEEVEELQDEVEAITEELQTWWNVVKNNDVYLNGFILDGIEQFAINAACEAIQVAAMCRKFRQLGGDDA